MYVTSLSYSPLWLALSLLVGALKPRSVVNRGEPGYEYKFNAVNGADQGLKHSALGVSEWHGNSVSNFQVNILSIYCWQSLEMSIYDQIAKQSGTFREQFYIFFIT